MAEIRDETNVPFEGWDRECLRAARDRAGRRLGDGERKRLGSASRTEKLRPRVDIGEDVILHESWAATRRRSRSGR